ncbi:MAG: Ser-Thr-rich GPI-anchored membrane family protein [Cyclobacteriaceae bacterium]
MSASGQSVENVVAQVESNGKVIITYDLMGDPDIERFNTTIYSSHNGYSSPLKNISGDVSTDYSVVPGNGKRVEWDAAAELGSFNGELAFEIRAEVYRFLRVTKPAAGKSVRRGSTATINWTGGQPSEKVKIELLKGGILASNLGEVNNSGAYNWSIPKEMEKGKDYTLRFTGTSGSITSESFAVNARFPLLLKIGLAVPVVIVIAAILGKSNDDGGALPPPPDPE